MFVRTCCTNVCGLSPCAAVVTHHEGDHLLTPVQVTKRMNFKQFMAALSLCADVRGLPIAEFAETVAATQPHVRGTIAAPVKWHDDRSTYTGVYAHGGPSTVDKQMHLKDFVDRDSASLTGKRHSAASPWAA